MTIAMITMLTIMMMVIMLVVKMYFASFLEDTSQPDPVNINIAIGIFFGRVNIVDSLEHKTGGSSNQPLFNGPACLSRGHRAVSNTQLLFARYHTFNVDVSDVPHVNTVATTMHRASFKDTVVIWQISHHTVNVKCLFTSLYVSTILEAEL